MGSPYTDLYTLQPFSSRSNSKASSKPLSYDHNAFWHPKTMKKRKNRIFTKTCFFIIVNGIGEVWGCPGGGGGPYEDIVSNFGRVWSYRTWGSRFPCFLEILETRFITKYLQICLRASRWVLGSLLTPGASGGTAFGENPF